jgi:hypothetical protein
MSTYAESVNEISAFEERKLQQEIKSLQQQKFSSLIELQQRDAVIAEKKAQLLRVKDAKVIPEGVLKLYECPICFIRKAEHIQTASIGHEDNDDPDIDIQQCKQCRCVIKSNS